MSNGPSEAAWSVEKYVLDEKDYDEDDDDGGEDEDELQDR